MQPIAIIVHGGAGPDSTFINENIEEYKAGLRTSILAGYKRLQNGGSAVDAVHEAVKHFEDNPLFNAGRGSAYNNKGKIQMDASIMDGATLEAGAVSMIENVKNPVTLARYVMEHTNHVLLSGWGAFQVANDANIEVENNKYFFTQHQYEELKNERSASERTDLLRQKIHGTVGAVALDYKGNIAAATSTGGTVNCLDGRIGDSCIIGAGCYADNNTCAISGTGDGEYLIRLVVGHSVASLVKYTGCSLQAACDSVIQGCSRIGSPDIGIISLKRNGDMGISFNSERMHRAWISSNQPLEIKIY